MAARRIGALLALVLLASVPSLRAQGPVTADSAREGSYLRAGDVVKLVVWREPDISGEFPVDERGSVVIPKLGRYDVRQHTPESLEAQLVEDFAAYLRNPAIDVIVLRRVKILGAVHRPGLFTLDPTMTLGDALAQAGGVVPTFGRRNNIRLIREGRVITTDLTEGTRVGDTAIRSGDEIYVPERSWILRNVGVLVSAGTALVSGVVIVLLAR
ncbi:MAG: polysaccharide biosynthesis/export family protein [Gemmatimonadetes bacterium]|nr:polysaccharide biosynthesis/export family protein [Gemmatimonadota bacterium]